MERYTHLDVNTDYLSEAEKAFLDTNADVTGAGSVLAVHRKRTPLEQYGWFVYVPEPGDRRELDEVPEGMLRHILAHACEQGISLVIFDCDGEWNPDFDAARAALGG